MSTNPTFTSTALLPSDAVASKSRSVLQRLKNLDFRSGLIALGLLGFLVAYFDKDYGIADTFLWIIAMGIDEDINRPGRLIDVVARTLPAIALIIAMLAGVHLFFDWWFLPNLSNIPL
ncbi:MAG: hypothetical protein WBD95_14965 [Xanthobacteraceae bacterium]